MNDNMDEKTITYNKYLLVITLIIGSFCTVLNQTLLTTAYPDLMKDFSVSTSTVQWLTTGFLLVNGIMIPISAYLMNNVPTKKLYFTAMLIFFIGTIICSTASTFNVILIGRLVQAVGVGISLPLLQTIMLTIFPKNERGKALGITGIVVGLAPAIGPTLSGWIIDKYTWRYLFIVLIPIVIIVLLMSLKFMENILPLNRSKLDWVSILLSVIGFGSILYAFSSVGTKGWIDPLVISLLMLGVLLITLFGKRQLTLDPPFLQIRVFRYNIFFKATILSGVVNMAMVGVEMVLPLYIQEIRHLTPLQSGLTLLPGALLLGIMMPITGRIFDKYGIKYLSITGMALLTIGTACLCTLTETTNMTFIVIAYMIRMLGVSMVMMTVTTAGMNSLPNTLLSHGTAVNNTVRQLFSSIGTAILISSLTLVTKNNMPEKNVISVSSTIYKKNVLQATLDGYNTSFIIATFFSFIGLVLAFYLTKNKKTTGIQ